MMEKVGGVCSGRGVTLLVVYEVVKQESLPPLQPEGMFNCTTRSTKGVHVSSPKYFVQTRKCGIYPPTK